MTTADRLVTFDNNILIDLRKNNKPTATYARQLLDFNREGKITVATTLSTMLEKQRAGEEMSTPELIAWLQELGFTNGHIFMGPRAVAFNVQGVSTWNSEGEIALNQCLHYAIFPRIPFRWHEFLDQQCVERGIVGRTREALIELDNKRHPYIPPSPQAPQELPTPILNTLAQDEREAVSYNGPRNLDTKRGENKIYSSHDEKTVYSSIQGKNSSGTLERREDAGTNCLGV